MADTDVVVIGSGVGGLCCGALLARYGLQVVVCESHSIPGGAAHSFERRGFRFDSGPSLYSGLSYSPSANPLRQVLDVIEEDVPWITYDAWGCYLPEGYFRASVGAEPFCELLAQWRGLEAVEEWQRLQQVMMPLREASVAIPPAALRADWAVGLTIARFAPSLLKQGWQMAQLSRPFSNLLTGVVKDEFIRQWLDLLCFMLSGLPSEGTIAAEVAFMFADWYRPGVKLDYPLGGGETLVNSLVRGLVKHGGKLRLNAHVEQILVEKERAVGVRLRSGETITASRAIISNTSVWDMLNLLPKVAIPPALQQRQQIPACPSFMHLHLGIDGTNLPPGLECHYLVVNDWQRGVTAPQNVVAISIPSILDPNLAPSGKHTIHAYTPATEPYSLWQGVNRASTQYQQLKQERAEVLWKGLERVIPDIRQRCEVTLVGTPLTHERFLRRDRGSYGPAIPAGLGLFPGCKTPLKGLLCCGDSTFPGIGIPAVAASGWVAANTLVSVPEHLAMLNRLRWNMEYGIDGPINSET